jgi:type IV pilus assembly protein PilE
MQVMTQGVVAMKRSAGFTVLEMMITLVIIAVLAAVAFPAYSQYVKRAREAEATTAIGDIRAAQLVYKSDIRQGNGYFALTMAALGWQMPGIGGTTGKGPAFYTYGIENVPGVDLYATAVTPKQDTVNHYSFKLGCSTGALQTLPQ